MEHMETPQAVAPQEIGMPSEEFRSELAALLNRHSSENGSDTPDFLLADFLCGCIIGWNASVRARDKWWNFKTRGERLAPDPSPSTDATPTQSP